MSAVVNTRRTRVPRQARQVEEVSIRSRRSAVRVSSDLMWLATIMVSQMRAIQAQAFGEGGMTLSPYMQQKKDLVPTLCAEIEKRECCVCMEEAARADVRRYGCGHETCAMCYDQIYKTTSKCPLCRAQITQVSRAPEKKIIRVKRT